MAAYRKVLFYTLLVLGILFIAFTASVFLFRDQIIKSFILEANKSLSTPIQIGKIDVSMFEDFPNLSIVCTDVYVEDSHPGQYPLLTAKTVSFQLNPVQVWQGIYIIKGLQVRDAEATLKINDKGVNNYTITSKGDGTPSAITFELANVKLRRVKVRYVSIPASQDMRFSSEQLTSSISTKDDRYTIEADGDLTTEDINIRRNSYFANKSFLVETTLLYDDIQKRLTIQPSTLQLRNSSFAVSGTYEWKDKNLIDLHTEGKDTDIQTLLSLLPESHASTFEKYQSNGDVYFKSSLKGEIATNKSPSLSVDFGFNDATLFHPDYNSRIEKASMEGSFASSDISNERMSVLVLKNIRGELDHKTFEANLVVQNFKDSDVQLDFRGELDAKSVFGFYPVETLTDITGTLLADVSFEGRLSWLKHKATAQRASTRGAIQLNDISFVYGKDKVPFRNLTGTLQFNNNDMALSDVSATVGNSDFLFNGFFKNVITYLLFEGQPIGIETDLKSNFLDLDQLFAIGFGKSGNTGGNKTEYEFSLSPNIYLNFNCDVKALRYKRFHATSVQGDLLVKNEVAVSRGLSLKTMGGGITLSGIVDAKNRKAIDLLTTARLDGIYVDSVFYVFENFDQSFIQDKHLKGKAYAEVNLEAALKPNLRLFPETLIADIGLSIQKGELNNFEPLKKLERYLDDEGLNHVKFSDLRNDIHIENKTIYIPQMEVRTNVTDLKISGTHTFDQQIDYRIVTPLRNRKKTSDSEVADAIEDDGTGHPKLFLKIIGTTSDYRVVYDTESVKKKIISDLKKEVQDLKDAFKNKGKKKKKELELQKDEYFEWEATPPDSTQHMQPANPGPL